MPRHFDDSAYNPLGVIGGPFDVGQLNTNINRVAVNVRWNQDQRRIARERVLRSPSYGGHGPDSPSADTGFGAGEPYHRAIALGRRRRPQRS